MPSFIKIDYLCEIMSFQFSNNILDDSPDHGVEDQFSLKLTNLHPNTYYRLSVASHNSRNGVMSESYVEFTTLGKSIVFHIFK